MLGSRVSVKIATLAALLVACSGGGSEDAGGGGADAARDAREAGSDRTISDGNTDARDARADAPGSADSSAPSLIALAVTSLMDASPSVALTPTFSPDIHDYYVRCSAGGSPLDVTIEASPGAKCAVVEPVTSAPRAKQTVSMTAHEGDAIVLVATEGKASTEYWVRCLPQDFPGLDWSPHPEAGAPSPGYYLLGNLFLASGVSGYAIVLDRNGVPVWYHAAPAGQVLYNVDTLTAGTISFKDHTAGPYELDRLVPWSAQPLGTTAREDLHELRHLSNGDYLVLTSKLHTGVDLTGFVAPLPDGGSLAFGASASMFSCGMVEFDSSGTAVWEWYALDHLDPVVDCQYPEFKVPLSDAGPVAIPFHCNALDVDPKSGDILLSGRNLDSVMYVERSTGKILWKMGGSPFTKDGARYVPVADPFHRQHDARLHGWSADSCGGGTGQVSVFDDETGMPNPARAVLYDVTVAPGDGGLADCGTSDAGTSTSGATVSWQVQGTSPSYVLGSFRIQADGARVVGWGHSAASPVTFTEFDDKGHDLVDFSFTPSYSAPTYRAIKVPPSALDLDALRKTAGHP